MNRVFNSPKTLLCLCISILLFTFTACQDDCDEYFHYTVLEPIYLSKEDVRDFTIVNSPSRTIENPGKMAFRGDWVYVNEMGKGVHIIDVANPDAPINTSFIEIDHNFDIHIKKGVLFADNYTDLLRIDIRDPKAVSLLERHEDIFEGLYSTNLANGIITGWTEREAVDTVLCGEPWETDLSQVVWWKESRNHYADPTVDPNLRRWDYRWELDIDTIRRNGNSGHRFFSYDTNSYLVTYTLNIDVPSSVFDITNPYNLERLQNAANPLRLDFRNNAYGLEFQDTYAILSNHSLALYDITVDNPFNYRYTTRANGFNICGSIGVQGDKMYATYNPNLDRNCTVLHEGVPSIIVTDFYNNTYVESQEIYPAPDLEELGGIDGDGAYTFVCAGQDGLRVYNFEANIDIPNVEDDFKEALYLLDQDRSIDPIDVIIHKENLYVIAEDGIYVYQFINEKLVKKGQF